MEDDDLIVGLDLTSQHATAAVVLDDRVHIIPDAQGHRHHAFDPKDRERSLTTIFDDARAHLQVERLSVVATIRAHATDDVRLSLKHDLVEAGWGFRRITNKPTAALMGAGVDMSLDQDTLHLICERDDDMIFAALLVAAQDVVDVLSHTQHEDLEAAVTTCLKGRRVLGSVQLLGGPWPHRAIAGLARHTGVAPSHVQDPGTVAAQGAARFADFLRQPIQVFPAT